ncbi:ABC transporter ATP-binding protein [Erwinia sorbitola]|uniref:ATP-binding cassette domain-containing protein n=1 Tax=Erwinia sorbitola TaxID=2681984 RepID=A0ABW9R714_9GAMM|nr:ABC transporter ATP-binding protein [Erwinia sorbitola]MTD25933.1 ATP-binding cassette domain-containing protein [Erwinia sorbitola]
MTAIAARNLTLSYQHQTIIDGLNISLPQGKITVLIGSNGSGKSTLLRSFARLLKPQQGEVMVNGENIQQKSTVSVARELAILPQNPLAPEGINVRQLVSLGRYPWQNWLQQWSAQDEVQVNAAMEQTGVAALANRPVEALSGGQRQRVWIAMTLAQDTGILLLDEPTTFLDLSHQIEVLDLLRDLNRQQSKTIIMVLHDLNLACRYADHLVAVHQRGVVAEGAPDKILSETLVKTVFDLNCRIIDDPCYGTPLVIPLSKQHGR